MIIIRLLIYSILTLSLTLMTESKAIRKENICSPSKDSDSRKIVIISDLHMGVGKNPENGEWYETEDFRWTEEFSLFLEKISKLGSGTDLIINGDLFELLQPLNYNCNHENNKNLSCTENEAIERLEPILKAHHAELKVLGMFADTGDNRIIMLPGNHDAALQFKAVSNMVLESIPAKDGRVCIASEGYWRSVDGFIYAEHGHQIGEDVNNFKENWPEPFIEKDGIKYLKRTWGEGFVQKFYNKIENKYPIIDNLSEETIGVKYGIAAEGLENTLDDIDDFLKFYLFQVSWEQFRQSLGPGTEQETRNWDVEAVKKENNKRFLIESLSPSPENDLIRTMAEKALHEGTLELSPKALSDNEIITLCNQRAVFKELQIKNGEKVTVETCPRKDKTLGALTQYFLSNDYKVFEEYLEKRYQELKTDKKKNPDFEIFIYGHTHKAHSYDKFYNKIKLPRYWEPKIFNSGAWQRVITPEQLEKLSARKKLKNSEVLHKLIPEDLSPCYSFIIIDYDYKGRPNAQLKYWSLNNKVTWEVADNCECD